MKTEIIQVVRRMAVPSLLTRRTWHADEPPATPAPAQPQPSDQTPPDEKAVDKDDAAKTFDGAYVKELRTENASWRKKVRDLEARVTEFDPKRTADEEAQLQDQKKFEELATKRERERDEFKSKYEAEVLNNLKLRVAAEYKLPAQLAARLVGNTEDELKADAEELARLIPAQPVQQETVPQPQQGKQPEPAPGRPQSTTTAVPGGQPIGRSDEQRRSEYFTSNPKNMPIFQGGKVVYHGNLADLEQDVPSKE